MKKLIAALSLLLSTAAFAATPRNDDSCDIAVLPAATLLLPYFEVDLDDPNGEKTIFSITNVTNLDRIAHVTLWTDRAYPVLDFNVFLTGYDVQSIDLHDVLARGVVGSQHGTGTAVSPKRGAYSDRNPLVDLRGCARLPGRIDDDTAFRVRRALTEGTSDECSGIGGRHERAIGYATIDVVGSCTLFTPLDAEYWSKALRHDNVLIGDYQQVDGRARSAQGGPLVHIRAVPGLERTFYARFQPASKPAGDRRQPLPSRFATRWIGGDASTSLKIWREAATTREAPCSAYDSNGDLDATEIVVFDEHENAVGTAEGNFDLPAVSRLDVAPFTNGGTAGWLYLNLDRDWRDREATQNWVITSMSAFGRFSADADAIALGNGCAPDVRPSEVTRAGGPPIAPARDAVESCDIALQPAATLLLPYFEVDVDQAKSETTLFSVTNVSPEPRVARVTLWTDWAVPLLTFDLALGGHAVQSIDLYDLLTTGVIAGESCDGRPRQLGGDVVKLLQVAFLQGRVPGGCAEVGETHRNAVGYATIDVVRNCSGSDPLAPHYWSDDLAFDNVLMGDYQQLDGRSDAAEGNAMVHIRAVAEGAEDALPRTFYSRLQSPHASKRDRRQPLPATFASRWQTGAWRPTETSFKIWREGLSGAGAACATNEENVAVLQELVRFDEAENAVAYVPVSRVTPIAEDVGFPATARVPVLEWPFLEMPNGATAGWAYMNLNHTCGCNHYSAYNCPPCTATVASQNWVVTSIRFPEQRYSYDADSAALGNGCSPVQPFSEATLGSAAIGPAPNRRR